MHYEFFCPVKIIAGNNAVDKIPVELKNLNVKSILLVTDVGVRKTAVFDKICSLLDKADKSFEYEVFSNVKTDPDSLNVSDIAAGMLDKDAVIAVGGGSVIDATKASLLLLSSGENDITKLSGVENGLKRKHSFFVVPTTCGTGSEVTKISVIKDIKSGLKLPYVSNLFFPDIVFIDPLSVETLPSKLIAATAIDALTHAIESYVSLQKNLLSDIFALKAIGLIFDNISSAVDFDKRALFNLLQASTFAGIAFSNSMVSMVHSIAHAIGSVCEIHHGVANALVLYEVLSFKKEKLASFYEEIFNFIFLFSNKLWGRNFLDSIYNLLNYLKDKKLLPSSLKEAGVKREDFNKIAEIAVVDGSSVFSRVGFEKGDVIGILESAF